MLKLKFLFNNERWDHEPSWLSSLRQRLEQAMAEDAAEFMMEL